MVRTNTVLNNFAGGEMSEKVGARSDLKVYRSGAKRLQNFYPLPQGPIEFRTGTKHVHHTRRNNDAIFIPFQFNDEQSYVIEATEQYFRFYTNNAIIVEDDITISGATQANPVVITATGHGYSDGDEVFINDVVGMTELNGKSYLVANSTTNTFEITDNDGTNIDGTGFTAYSSAGVAQKIYELATPYLLADLPNLQYAQNADTMFITDKHYSPRVLTRSGNTNWSLARQVRTGDPFTSLLNITNITRANPAVVTVSTSPHNIAAGKQIYIDNVSGMTEINSGHYLVANPTATTMELQDLDGNNIDSTTYTAYSSSGVVELYDAEMWPRAVTLTDDGRLLYGHTNNNPETIWASQAPTAGTGTANYGAFTVGVTDTDAFVFTLAPIHGQVDSIQWLTNSDKFILAGTYGTVRRLFGATEQDPITATSITAKSVNTYGCALLKPVSNGINVFYAQRGKQILRSFGYDYTIDGYMTTDRNLLASHLLSDGIRQVTSQLGELSTVWAVIEDGRLMGMTYNDKEDISGWHRQLIAGSHVNSNGVTRSFGKVRSAAPMPRGNEEDQLWVCVERTINGNTRRYVEYLTDTVSLPLKEDFFTGEANSAADAVAYRDAIYELSKDQIHVDSALTYDGASFGTDASATLTPGATTGTGVTFTASAAVFTSDMVGRQLWGMYDETGAGGGRATITAFTSTTEVTCDIDSDFASTSAISAGDWRITATSLSGLDYLEGESVAVVGDGKYHGDFTVSSGAITLAEAASIAHVGLKYTGIMKTLNLDAGGVTGSALYKERIVIGGRVAFLNTVGAKYGTSLYDLEDISFTQDGQVSGRGTPMFSGTQDFTYEDSTEAGSKNVLVVQTLPLPCLVQAIDVEMETTDE